MYYYYYYDDDLWWCTHTGLPARLVCTCRWKSGYLEARYVKSGGLSLYRFLGCIDLFRAMFWLLLLEKKTPAKKICWDEAKVLTHDLLPVRRTTPTSELPWNMNTHNKTCLLTLSWETWSESGTNSNLRGIKMPHCCDSDWFTFQEIYRNIENIFQCYGILKIINVSAAEIRSVPKLKGRWKFIPDVLFMETS